MRTRLIIMIIMILPLFVDAQNFNPPKPQMQDPLFNLWGNKRPELPQTPTVKPLYRSRAENAQAKLAIEERKLIKIAKKAWAKEADLKKEKENLKNLENTPETDNNAYHQKKIEKSKKQIAKSQDKLNKLKTEVDSKSKKVENMEKAIEAAKLKKEEDY
ncbi:hypothetical protein [Flavobacterium sp.]|uniref:hypothetical protein n=1 Tax=Flavobacterium sp. TaxID=239 RepID=UPI0025BF933A|nr:hypothetical protein [Flavobacterium sp.]MBA4276527.1 hypothetical protein [Flavobacterium sp.]